MNEEYFENMYNYCKSNRGHLLVKRVYGQPGDVIWADHAFSYCSRCMCELYERRIGEIHYHFWVNPSNKKILEVGIFPLEYDEEKQRFRLRKEI